MAETGGMNTPLPRASWALPSQAALLSLGVPRTLRHPCFCTADHSGWPAPSRGGLSRGGRRRAPSPPGLGPSPLSPPASPRRVPCCAHRTSSFITYHTVRVCVCVCGEGAPLSQGSVLAQHQLLTCCLV